MNGQFPGLSPFVEQALDIRYHTKMAKEKLCWGLVNSVVLLLLMLTMPKRTSYRYYIQFMAVCYFVVRIIAYTYSYIMCRRHLKPLYCTEEQRDLLAFAVEGPNFVCHTPTTNIDHISDHEHRNTIDAFFINCFTCVRNRFSIMRYKRMLALRLLAWQRYIRNNYGYITDYCSKFIGSKPPESNSQYIYEYKAPSEIADHHDLSEFLLNQNHRINNSIDESGMYHGVLSPSPTSPSWPSYARSMKMMKTSLYQLSNSSGSQSKEDKDDLRVYLFCEPEFMGNISSEKLSKYITKLRKWIATTILHRVVNEINSTDEFFHSRHIDLKIGRAGLERLKAAADINNTLYACPQMLPLLLEFLNLTPNQEYLVQRIKDLARGSCMTNYQWESNSFFHNFERDESLPTDAAIIFHMFCVYLDSQLVPLPKGSGRPFHSRYVIVAPDKPNKNIAYSISNRTNCAILFTESSRPKFNFISDGKVHPCPNDRNSVFYVLIQFLIYMKKRNNGILENICLGEGGINILCVLDN